MFVIRARNFIRKRLGISIRAEVKERAYLTEYPWLEQLWPMGLRMHWNNGIKFEELKPERLNETPGGWMYFLSKSGTPLAHIGPKWSTTTFGDYLKRAYYKLIAEPSRIHYIVWVGPTYDGTINSVYVLRIHRVPKGQTLDSYLEYLFAEAEKKLEQYQKLAAETRERERAEAQLEAQRAGQAD